MNRQFKDTRYYLKRAFETAVAGVAAELAPVERRLRELTGREQTEPGRLDDVKADLGDVRSKAEGAAKASIADARERIETYRQSEA